MPVVTISRQFGAGGHTLGERVAERLNYQLVDRDIIYQVAREAKVSEDWVEAVEKDAGGLLMRICSGLVSSSFIERLLGDSASDFDEKKYCQFIRKIIGELAEKDNVVIVGRASQFILEESPRVVKILLVAELSDRIKFMMEHYNLTRNKAEQVVRREEKRRYSFLKSFDNRNPDDSSLYALVVNTSRIGLADTEDMVVKLAEEAAKK